MVDMRCPHILKTGVFAPLSTHGAPTLMALSPQKFFMTKSAGRTLLVLAFQSPLFNQLLMTVLLLPFPFSSAHQ